LIKIKDMVIFLIILNYFIGAMNTIYWVSGEKQSFIVNKCSAIGCLSAAIIGTLLYLYADFR